MREKVKSLIYLDAERYIDIGSVKILPWATIILPFSVIIGSSALQWTGMLVAACICFFSSLILVRLLQSSRIKKTFRLRFFGQWYSIFIYVCGIFALYTNGVNGVKYSNNALAFISSGCLYFIIYMHNRVYGT